jgi:hypothetical protein
LRKWRDNRLTLLPDGPERLEALIALIESARVELRVLYYIYKQDQSGTRVRDALVASCRRGVKVSLLVDGFGSDAAPGFFQPLIDAGCRFCRYSARVGRRYLLRNHQKLVLADGARVIIGGFNIEDSYFGTVESGAWRDLGLLSRGRASPAWPTISIGSSPGHRSRTAASANCAGCFIRAAIPKASSTGCSAARPAAEPLGARGAPRHGPGPPARSHRRLFRAEHRHAAPDGRDRAARRARCGW